MPRKYKLRFIVVPDPAIAKTRVHHWYNVETKESAYGVEVQLKEESTWAHVAERSINGATRIIIARDFEYIEKLRKKLLAGMK